MVISRDPSCDVRTKYIYMYISSDIIMPKWRKVLDLYKAHAIKSEMQRNCHELKVFTGTRGFCAHTYCGEKYAHAGPPPKAARRQQEQQPKQKRRQQNPPPTPDICRTNTNFIPVSHASFILTTIYWIASKSDDLIIFQFQTWTTEVNI